MTATPLPTAIATSTINPLDRSIIDEATKRFAADEAVTKRLAWWLLHGHASERWFQFEWAYRLSDCLQNQFEVGCEHNRVDVALFQAPISRWPLWENMPTAGVEIKWFGNWWVDPTFQTVQNDIRKIRNYIFPALALTFYLIAAPQSGSDEYSWISRQIAKGIGMRSMDDIKSAMAKVEMKPEIDFPVAFKRPAPFESLSLHVIGFRNPKSISA